MRTGIDQTKYGGHIIVIHPRITTLSKIYSQLQKPTCK
jgi:hypothetical protein